MNLICPVCKFEIPEKLIDLSEESAFCPHCQKDFDCSRWMKNKLVAPENLRTPPNGAWFKESASGFKVGVSTRSYKWLFFLPIASGWSGLLLFFSWAIFFHPVDQATQMTVFVFLTPFYLFGLFFWGCVLMCICGEVEIEVDEDSGTVFKGIGAIGWKRRFDWNQITKIRLSKIYNPSGMGNQQQIALEGEKVLLLAKNVKAERLRFMLIALLLMRRKIDLTVNSRTSTCVHSRRANDCN